MLSCRICQTSAALSMTSGLRWLGAFAILSRSRMRTKSDISPRSAGGSFGGLRVHDRSSGRTQRDRMAQPGTFALGSGAPGRTYHHAAGRGHVGHWQDASPPASDIELALAKYIRDPVVTVIVTTSVGSSNEQIRVIGEATKPQVLPYRKRITVLDVMIAVGGLTDFADGNSASIFRPSEGGKLYAVRLRDLVKRGDISANVEMQPGDILIIPQGLF